jgi:serine protease inhibitor
MNKYYSIIFTLLLFSSLFAEDISPTQKLVTANNDFGFRLFSELIKQEDIKNIFISPTSIAMALAMTYNGADSTTKDAMAKTLAVEQLSIKEFNQANLELRNSLIKKDKKITINIANSLWADKGTQFKKDFLATNKKYYGAKVTTLDFSNPTSTKIINQWVNDATKNKIKKIIEEIGEDVIAFLINAIYFKGAWQTEFNKDATADRTFYCIDGKEKLHPMMSQNGKYNYLKNDKLQAITP